MFKFWSIQRDQKELGGVDLKLDIAPQKMAVAKPRGRRPKMRSCMTGKRGGLFHKPKDWEKSSCPTKRQAKVCTLNLGRMAR